MTRDLSLAKETEQFSFIDTIAVYSEQNSISQDRYSTAENIPSKSHADVLEESLKPHKSSSKSSSALCSTASSDSELSDLLANSATISDEWYSIDKLETNSVFEFAIAEELQNQQQKNTNSYLDKLFLFLSLGYLCFILWTVFGQNNSVFSLSLFTNKKTISKADLEFIDYMERSLATIDRQLEQKESRSNKPTVAASKPTSEIVYVPIYTPNQTVKPDNKITFPQLNTLPPPPPSKLSTIINPPVSNIAIKSPPPPSELVPTKTTPTLESTTSSKIAEQATVPQVKSSLIGIMELKEGSAALFKINGVTQRIWLGEKIENTNWTLDSIVGQKAVISNNKNQRTVGVGEFF